MKLIRQGIVPLATDTIWDVRDRAQAKHPDMIGISYYVDGPIFYVQLVDADETPRDWTFGQTGVPLCRESEVL